METETQVLLKYLLDKVDPLWHKNAELIACYNKLSAGTKRFVPPTMNEVSLELKSLGVRHPISQGEKFWNFYESKNWMIGKNKMKNWKAAIKTWNFDKDNLIL